MKVITILLTLLFFSGLVFSTEDEFQVEKSVYRNPAFDELEDEVMVAQAKYRTPAIIEYEIKLESADVKYWKFQ